MPQQRRPAGGAYGGGRPRQVGPAGKNPYQMQPGMMYPGGSANFNERTGQYRGAPPAGKYGGGGGGKDYNLGPARGGGGQYGWTTPGGPGGQGQMQGQMQQMMQRMQMQQMQRRMQQQAMARMMAQRQGGMGGGYF